MATAGIETQCTELMERGSRALGLRLCFHDFFQRSGLETNWLMHDNPACMQVKNREACMHFGVAETHAALAGRREGRLQTCPFGYTEIAMPVVCDGVYAGVLFAGQCWCQDEPPPHPSLAIPPHDTWLQDKSTLVKALATELGRLLEGDPTYTPQDRRQQIRQWMRDHSDRPVTLSDLAATLHLSTSRTSRVVRESFGMTFSQLVREQKLKQAAYFLSTGDYPVAEVARFVGMDDPNYFSRVFRTQYGMPPREFRKRHAIAP